LVNQTDKVIKSTQKKKSKEKEPGGIGMGKEKGRLNWGSELKGKLIGQPEGVGALGKKKIGG